MRSPNPFKPTAGMDPPELIGRREVLEEFAESVENGPGAPDRLMRIPGIRGVGKTALLNALGDVARSYGFNVINVSSNPGFCARIAEEVGSLLPSRAVTIAPEALGFKLGSVAIETRPPALLNKAMLEASRGRGLFITLDEVQDADLEELRALGNDIQLVIREGGDIAFAFAGLPKAVDAAVNWEGLTFLQRATEVRLGRLSDHEVSTSFESTIEETGMSVPEEVARCMATASEGYPFMVQLVGYHCWQAAVRRGSQVIEAEDAEGGIERARGKFDSSVVEPMLARLPQGQRDYLGAMAVCGEEAGSGDVARAMGRAVEEVSSYRRRLVATGVIEPQGRGRTRFAVPRMREYLLAHRA